VPRKAVPLAALCLAAGLSLAPAAAASPPAPKTQTAPIAYRPTKVLAARDLDAFIANYAALDAALAGFGGKYDAWLDATAAESASANPGEITESIARLRAAVPPAELAATFRRYGLGERGLEKYLVISYGFGALYFAQLMDAEFAGKAPEGELRSYVEESRRTFAAMRAAIHPDDLALIAARLDRLIKLQESAAD